MGHNPEDVREFKIAAEVLGAILLPLCVGFLAFQKSQNYVFSFFAITIVAITLNVGFFAPIKHRGRYFGYLGIVAFVIIGITALFKIDIAVYKAIGNVLGFVLGLAIVVALLVVAVDSTNDTSVFQSRSRGVNSAKINNLAMRSGKAKSDDHSFYRYNVDEHLVQQLVDLLNQGSAAPSKFQKLLNRGAKNSIISFRYKKLSEPSKRRLVQVKKVDGRCLGCFEISSRSYKSFRFDRISEVRAE